MRTVTSLCRHLGRSSRNWFTRFLVLCDSMVTIGAVRKMRSSSRSLLVQLRKIAAVTLATGVRLTLRWIPTDMNPADGPSRGEAVGSAVITQEKADTKKIVPTDQNSFSRLFSSDIQIEGLHEAYDQHWHL